MVARAVRQTGGGSQACGGRRPVAADACGDNGLQVVQLGSATQRRLRGLLPAGAVVTGPVDTTAAVTTDSFRACQEAVAADDRVDAVLAVAVPRPSPTLAPRPA